MPVAGEQVGTTDRGRVAEAVAFASEQIPYYVHHLVADAARWCDEHRQVMTPPTMPNLVDAALNDPDDPWNLRHYRERIPLYYPSRADLVGDVLDAYAHAGAMPRTIDDVLPRSGRCGRT